MLNCSGMRMACHSSSDLCTGPGGGVDDDIADTPGNLRPAGPRDGDAAARPRHGRAAHEKGAAAGEGARRREESGREARGATAEGRGHECDAILRLSSRWTRMVSRSLSRGLCGAEMMGARVGSLWNQGRKMNSMVWFGSNPNLYIYMGLPGG